MNKLVLGIVGGVVVVGAGAAIVITLNNNKTATVTNTATGQTANVKTGDNAVVKVDACDVLTQSIANQALGATATKGDTSAGNASSEALSVTNCVYTVKIDPAAIKPNNTKGVSVLARSALTSAGAKNNKDQFGPQKPAGVQDVSGIGDAAFYNPQFGQLNVLKGGNWYIVSSYSGSVTTGASLASDTALAQMLTFK